MAEPGEFSGGEERPHVSRDYGGVTDIGSARREQNEDVLGIYGEKVNGFYTELYLVADGMGGHQGGLTASTLGRDEIARGFFSNLKEFPVPQTALTRAIQAADVFISQKAASSRSLQGMGTTIVAAAVEGNQATVANVGDSKAILVDLRNGQHWPASTDHSWVAMMVQEGTLTPEEARVHPQRNVVTQSLGSGSVRPAVWQVDLDKNRALVMFSDGLEVLTDKQIASAVSKLAKKGKTMQQVCLSLVEMAKKGKTQDNVTVVAIKGN